MPTTKQTKPFKDALGALRKHRSFLITAHHNPDADAAASSLAMALFLKSLGKKVTVVNEDALPEWLEYLPLAKSFKRAKDTKPFKYDAAIVLDCGGVERIGGVTKLIDQSKPVINIDHHITNTKFGNINTIIDISSTCEILFELFKGAGYKMTKSMAELLYAGIMTDTGSFRYENTTARTHDIVAELMRFGIKSQETYERHYPGIPVKDMKGFIQVIHEAKLLMNDRVYCVVLTAKGLMSFSKKFDLKEKLFTFLRTVEGIEVVVILTELSSKETRLNFRSQGDFDVAKLAQQFNGGGHRKASGAKIYDGLQVAEKQVLAAIAKALKG